MPTGIRLVHTAKQGEPGRHAGYCAVRPAARRGTTRAAGPAADRRTRPAAGAAGCRHYPPGGPARTAGSSRGGGSAAGGAGPPPGCGTRARRTLLARTRLELARALAARSPETAIAAAKAALASFEQLAAVGMPQGTSARDDFGSNGVLLASIGFAAGVTTRLTALVGPRTRSTPRRRGSGGWRRTTPPADWPTAGPARSTTLCRDCAVPLT